ncbi:MAG: DUF2806 domain-containing protein [Patiriisocius sp.]|uniref:DUF2806 domain-containing protein n=1 Tax=Patiriisocius sp. TaxID=2822396 RepID=UPI003EFADC30
MIKNKIYTEEDLKAVVYIIDYIAEEYFPDSTNINTTEYKEIVDLMDAQIGKSLGVSTLQRLFSIRDKPHAISYNSLDTIVKWCFEGEYSSYKEFLNKAIDVYNNYKLITAKDIHSILETLNGKKQNITHKIKLGKIPISFNIDEGFTQKLIKEVSIITGDLITKQIKNTQKLFGVTPNPRINERLFLRETRRQNNIDEIVAKAIGFARQKEASKEHVSQDWIVEFFDIAQNYSNENMQYLWAKLLASEIEQPNSISRRTLSIIKLLEPNEAKVFTKLCNCIWNFKDTTGLKEKILILDMYRNEQYSDETWDFDSMFIPHLISIGLVSDSFIDMDHKRIYNLNFFGKKHELHSSKKLDQLSVVTLSRAGKEVFNIIEPTPNYEYYNFTIDYFNKVNVLKK